MVLKHVIYWSQIDVIAASKYLQFPAQVSYFTFLQTLDVIETDLFQS
jgi:hypothetical protein